MLFIEPAVDFRRSRGANGLGNRGVESAAPRSRARGINIKALENIRSTENGKLAVSNSQNSSIV